MSYYNPGQPGTYPYGYTPATYTQTPGSYASYSYPPTAVTGYGTTWPYYSYVPPQHRTTTTATVPRTPATNSTTTSTANRGTSFATTHTPASYADTINAAGGSGNTRTGSLASGSKRQANLKGLFTKERERVPENHSQIVTDGPLFSLLSVRNLMYGFGDDRSPANDTVNVMEEILIEYIVDVVSFLSFNHPTSSLPHESNSWHPSVRPL